MFRNFVNPVKNSSNNIIECLWQHTLLHFSRIQMAIRIRGTSTISNVQSLIDENEELTEMKKDEDDQKEKNARVMNLMNKLKPNNDGSNLENFEPLDNKPLSNKQDKEQKKEEMTTEGMTTSPSTYLPKNTRPEPGMFRPNNLNQENMSNLKETYNGRMSFMQKKTTEGLDTNQDSLAEKINYMIHLLEQQQAEKNG